MEGVGVARGWFIGRLTRWPKRHWPICAHDRYREQLLVQALLKLKQLKRLDASVLRLFSADDRAGAPDLVSE